MRLRCPNCKWTWDYTGKKKHNATCPDCGNKVRIEPMEK